MTNVLSNAEIVAIFWEITFLLAAFLGSCKFRLGQLARYYILQTLCLAGLLLGEAINTDAYFYWSVVAVVVIKIGIVVGVISRTSKRTAVSGRLTSLIRPAPTYFVSGFALLLAIWAAMTSAPHLSGASLLIIVSAFSAMFLGAIMMAVRLDFYSQMVGFLTFENGTTLLITATLGVVPLLLTVLMSVGLTLTILLMCLLSRRLKELFAVEDTGQFSDSRD